MTISDLEITNVADYLRVEFDSEDAEQYRAERQAIELAMSAALQHMTGYTGRSEEFIKAQDDLGYVYLALCAEIYENRQIRLTQGQYKNELVYQILDKYCVNFLPGEAELVAEDAEDA